MSHLLVTYLPGEENVPGFPHEVKRIDGYALDTVARFRTDGEVADYLRENPDLSFVSTHQSYSGREPESGGA